jgi:hypothetical protein
MPLPFPSLPGTYILSWMKWSENMWSFFTYNCTSNAMPGGSAMLSSSAPCSFGLSATSQQYFSLRTNQPLAISQQYFSLRTNQQQTSATSRTNMLPVSIHSEVKRGAGWDVSIYSDLTIDNHIFLLDAAGDCCPRGRAFEMSRSFLLANCISIFLFQWSWAHVLKQQSVFSLFV